MNELSPLATEDMLTHPNFMRPAIDDAAHAAHTAALTRQWPEMHDAIDVLIERQQAIVDWWRHNVAVHHGGDRRSSSHGTGNLKVAEAEKLIGFSDSTLSRFRTALQDIEAYRERLTDRVMREAGLISAIKDPNALRPTPDRDGPDFWPSPACLIDAYIDHILGRLPLKTIWECAAGDGRLGHAIQRANRAVIMTDKYPQASDVGELDFLHDAPPDKHLIASTNPSYSLLDEFIERGLMLLDRRAILGFVLLLRHDHFQAGTRVDWLNRATFETHCNWRPLWIDGTKGQPRWAFTWVGWLDGPRQPPTYVANVGPVEAVAD
jgi:hypothetical protein